MNIDSLWCGSGSCGRTRTSVTAVWALANGVRMVRAPSDSVPESALIRFQRIWSFFPTHRC